MRHVYIFDIALSTMHWLEVTLIDSRPSGRLLEICPRSQSLWLLLWFMLLVIFDHLFLDLFIDSSFRLRI